MLKIQAINAYYGRAHVLHNISLDITAGSVTVVLGRNGAGKSTLMKTLIGLVPPRSGKIAFQGAQIAGWEPYRIARLGLGYVPEERRIFTELSVLENLDIGRQPGRDGRPAWTPEQIFEIFPNLGQMRTRPGGRMSGGEQQMLTIARTLMGNPRLLLLDEPSEGLSPLIVEQMAGAIEVLQKQGVTVFLAEQNLHFAMRVADQAAVIESGRIVWRGSVQDLRQDAEISAQYLAV